MREKRARLYEREYPLLLQQIEWLIALAREEPNIAALVLFGSTARLEPGATSDADLLALLHNPYLSLPGNTWPQIVDVVVKAEEDSSCSWPFSIVDGDAQASDLDPDFLENVARDGVLLYQQEGVSLPVALRSLQPYEHWLKRVEALMARASRARAASPF